MKPQRVKVNIIDRNIFGSLVDEKSYEDDTVTSMIAWLQSMPDGAKISVETERDYGDRYNAHLTIYYYRDETDEEVKIRMIKEQQRLEDRRIWAARQLQQAQAELAKLQGQ